MGVEHRDVSLSPVNSILTIFSSDSMQPTQSLVVTFTVFSVTAPWLIWHLGGIESYRYLISRMQEDLLGMFNFCVAEEAAAQICTVCIHSAAAGPVLQTNLHHSQLFGVQS